MKPSAVVTNKDTDDKSKKSSARQSRSRSTTNNKESSESKELHIESDPEDDRLTEASSTGYISDVPEVVSDIHLQLPPVEEEPGGDQDDRSTQDSVVAPEEVDELNAEDDAEFPGQTSGASVLPSSVESTTPENVVPPLELLDAVEGEAFGDRKLEEPQDDDVIEEESIHGDESKSSGDQQSMNDDEEELVGEADVAVEGSAEPSSDEEMSQDYSSNGDEEVDEDNEDDVEEDDEYTDVDDDELEVDNQDAPETSDSEAEEVEPVPPSFSFASAFRGTYQPPSNVGEIVDLASSSDDSKHEKKPQKKIATKNVESNVHNTEKTVEVKKTTTFSFPSSATTATSKFTFPVFPSTTNSSAVNQPSSEIKFNFPSTTPAIGSVSSKTIPQPTIASAIPQPTFTFPIFPPSSSVVSSGALPTPGTANVAPNTPELSKVLDGVPSPVKMAIDAFNKVGSKLILATAAKYRDVEGSESLTLSEKEYDILKDLLNQIKPKSSVNATAVDGDHVDKPVEKKQKVDTLTVDVDSIDDSREVEQGSTGNVHGGNDTNLEDEGEDEKRIKFNAVPTVIRSRLSLDGIGPSSPFEDNFSSTATKFNHVGTPFNRRASTSVIPSSHNRMFTRQPTPFHKDILGDKDESDVKKKRSYFDYEQDDAGDAEEDYDHDFSAKKRLSVSFDNVSTVISTPASSLTSASKRVSTGGLDRFSASRLSFVPQFKGASVQFSTFTAPAMNHAKSAEASNLSYIERRKLHRSSVGSSNVVAKQILEALSTIPTPAAEKPITASSSTLPTKPQNSLRIGQNLSDVPVMNPKVPIAPIPSVASAQPNEKEAVGNKSLFPGAVSNLKAGPVETITKTSIPEFNLKLPVNAPTSISTVSKPSVNTQPAAMSSQSATITLTKSASQAVPSDSEFTFEEPLVVTGVDDSISDTLDNTICYVFSPPNQPKVVTSVVTATSSVAINTTKPSVESKLDQTSKESPSTNIWSKSANTDKKKCKVCLVMNDKNVSKCVSCESPFGDGGGSSAPASVAVVTSSSSSVPNIWAKAAEGAKCKVCLVMNKKDAAKCVSCESPLGAGAAPVVPSVSVESGPSKFIFGVVPSTSGPITNSTGPSTVGFTFGAPPSGVSGNVASSSSSVGGFTFGSSSSTSSSASSTTVASSGFTFGVPLVTTATKSEPVNEFKSQADSKKVEAQPSFGIVSDTKPSESSADKPSFTFGVTSATSSKPALSTTSGFTFGVTKTSESTERKSEAPPKPVIPALVFPPVAAPATSAISVDFGSKRNTDEIDDGGRRNKRRSDEDESANSGTTTSSLTFAFPSSTTSATAAPGSTTTAAFGGSTFSFGTAPASSATVTPPVAAPALSFSFGTSNERKEEKKASSPATVVPSTSLPTSSNNAPITSFSFGSTSVPDTKIEPPNTKIEPPNSATPFGGFGVKTDSVKPTAPASNPFSFGGTGNVTTNTTAPFGNTSAVPPSADTKPLFGGPPKADTTVNAPFSSVPSSNTISAPFSFGSGASSSVPPSGAPVSSFGGFGSKTDQKPAPVITGPFGASGVGTTTTVPGIGGFGSGSTSTKNPFGVPPTSTTGPANVSATSGTGFFGGGNSAASGPFGGATSSSSSTPAAQNIVSGPFGNGGFSAGAATATPAISGPFGGTVSQSNQFGGTNGGGFSFGGGSSTISPSPSGGMFAFAGSTTPSPAPMGGGFGGSGPAFPSTTSTSGVFGGSSGGFGGSFPAQPSNNPFPSIPGGDGGFSLGADDKRRKVKVRRPGGQ